MKSKEDILNKEFIEDCGQSFVEFITTNLKENLINDAELAQSTIESSMDEYAREVAIDFLEWVHFNYHLDKVVGFYIDPATKEVYETKELFELYKESKL